MCKHANHGPDPGLELWAGVECSVVRVGDEYYDQLKRSGHATRPGDLDLIAGLGVRTLRYPVLWERTVPDESRRADWSWPDDRLGRLRRLGVRPIVGLVHHGSGPRHTDLADAGFADGLAGVARDVAGRYPWLEDYTPVNEPLTTARFSGLYGHWYPHGRDDRTFVRALLNQCRAVVLAMRAIRTVNSAARLVQTDDLGKTFSTPTLAYQADFENERRWLTFDLLCARVGRDHPMWSYFRSVGIGERELGWFLDNPCPPDVVGLNYYPTSERFLDHDLQPYPPDVRGGNAKQAYADVEAVRVLAGGMAGPRALLNEAWGRFRLPLALTETHLGCTREEQLRWLVEVWDATRAARDDGVDVRAVTAWSILGSYDWDSLMTRPDGRYEPGAFDMRSPRPRLTALAGLLRTIASGRDPDSPVLGSPGWWNRPERILYPPVDLIDKVPVVTARSSVRGRSNGDRPVAIVGAAGALGQAFERMCDLRGLKHRLVSRRQVDPADAASVAAALDRIGSWAVIDVGGYTSVDDAELDQAASRRDNVEGPAALAVACARRGIAMMAFSSDLVFGGGRKIPYTESDDVDPLNVFGRTKAEMEKTVLAALPTALIIRAGAHFGPWDEDNFVTDALRALADRQPFLAADDAVVSPTYLPDLVHAALDLLIDGERGVWHLANAGAITWADLARRAAEMVGLDPDCVEGLPAGALEWAARRPDYCALASERGALMPTLEDALARYLREGEMGWAMVESQAAGRANLGLIGRTDRYPGTDLVALPSPRN